MEKTYLFQEAGAVYVFLVLGFRVFVGKWIEINCNKTSFVVIHMYFYRQ